MSLPINDHCEHIYSFRYLVRLFAVGVVRTTVKVFVGRASFERECQRFERMDELGHVLSLVLGYQESLVVGPVCDNPTKVFYLV